jgi:hypothetical protein
MSDPVGIIMLVIQSTHILVIPFDADNHWLPFFVSFIGPGGSKVLDGAIAHRPSAKHPCLTHVCEATKSVRCN